MTWTPSRRSTSTSFGHRVSSSSVACRATAPASTQPRRPRRRRSPRPPAPRGCPRRAARGAPRTAPGVRENRGAGAGCGRRRARRRCRARPGAGGRAPRRGRAPGVTQASVPAKSAAHSSRVRVANASAIRRRCSGQCARRAGAPGSAPVRPEPVEQRGVELRLQRADGDVPAVGARVGVVERRPAVEQVGRPPVPPEPGAEQPVDHGDQRAGAVDHRRVDDLPAAAGRRARAARPGSPTTRNIEPPPKSAPMFSGGDGLVRRPDGVQGAGQAEVVDVVPGPLRRAGRPGPSRSSARRPAAGCGPGTRRGRGPAAR